MPEWLDKLRGRKNDGHLTGPAPSKIKWAERATSQEGYGPVDEGSIGPGWGGGTFADKQQEARAGYAKMLADVRAGNTLPSYTQDVRSALKLALQGEGLSGTKLDDELDSIMKKVKVR